MEKAQKFLESIVKELVEFPNEVRVGSRTDEMGVLLTLHVAQTDMGKVIGKEGQTANAIRTLLRIVGAKNNSRVTMKIAEPNE